jgi:hypothetical protein
MAEIDREERATQALVRIANALERYADIAEWQKKDAELAQRQMFGGKTLAEKAQEQHTAPETGSNIGPRRIPRH